MSRPVLIVDTSIWIDLAKNGLLEQVPKLAYEIMISHFVWNELRSTPTSQELEDLGFLYRGFAPHEIDSIGVLKTKHRGLSLADASNIALVYIAGDREIVFLATVDSRLQKAAQAEGIECKDALDLLNDWVEMMVIGIDEARRLGWELRRGSQGEADRRYFDMVCRWEAKASRN